MSVPELTLNNGVQLPTIGLGVFQASPEETVGAVRSALETGYRHIDTATAYHNEEAVGQGIRESGVPRDELFIETKVWIADYGAEATLRAFENSARKLGVETIDLLILHQPAPHHWEQTLAAYHALEELLGQGKVRAIGVSNFQKNHLEALLKEASVVPAVNQIELHPYFQEKSLVAANAKAGILTQAWSPIGGITFYPGWGGSEARSTLKDPTIVSIAQAHGKTPAQVMLRWGIQEGRSVIPKSVKPSRIAENFDIFDFELNQDEMKAVDGLDTGVRGGPDPNEF
ncbi:oxidoreductase [Bombiscardovia apis]|uniref:Oxidoreductase n=1 Tax=Bombiscardovia apis TaxID=2932182 RepID=A0ABM8BBL4_9BIFI|nr:aldo/keto reductase [Bombiscardovia apis]BDR54303.1 oxidoreductase [Bombiscardovia apis]